MSTKRKQKAKASQLEPTLRYALYEAAVQDPFQQAHLFEKVYREKHGELPHALREDFCGTFLISSEWVKRSPKNTAVALDLDPEPLAYGKRTHYAKLNPSQRKRLRVFEQNVLEGNSFKADVIAACNFSFFTFKERATLIEYFRQAKKSLHPGGALVLEMAGGSGFIDTPFHEDREVQYVRGKHKGDPWFTYRWAHRSYEPLTHHGLYTIGFTMETGEKYPDAFVYDWRVWTLPEVQECAQEAGFTDIRVYWECEDEDDGDGESTYELITEAGNEYETWIAYVAAFVSS
ncbi:MAG: class I SAM-dependent methyltransferase [Bdellovibrionales bacterium]|nr:class I SAM-dependent methyltransferase [Bdellovibrionales bacterium]